MDIIVPTLDWRTITSTTTLTPITHELHPTGLEQFMACPYRFKHDSDRSTSNVRDAFYTGDIVEQLMTAYQYGEKLGDEVLRNFWNSTEFPNYSQLRAHAENWKNYIKAAPTNVQERYPLFTQKRMTLRILMDAQTPNPADYYHEIYLTWTADRVYSDYSIADCKCYKQKRWKNEPDRRIQWRIYPWMWRVTSNLPQLKRSDNFSFTYYIFTKQVKPQLQVVNLNYRYEDSERLVYHMLSEYVKFYDNDVREPKKCLACKWCPLRNQCPRFAEDGLSSFTTPEPAQEWEEYSEEWEWRF